MRISDDGLTLLNVYYSDINYNGTFTIPESVTSIGDWAFVGCTSLTSITIPNSVTSIGNYAFNECTSLTGITIPNSVTSIGICTFHGCTSLTNITIPNSVTSIGDYAFQGCTNLTNIVIASNDDEVIARIKALLPDELQSNVVTKAAHIKAKLIQDNTLAVIECTAISPGLANALPTDALHLLIAGFAGGEHVADQVKQAIQAVPIPAIDDSQGWIDYAAQVKDIAAQQQQQQQQQQREAEFTTAHPFIAFAINHPYATSAVLGLLTALAVAATISTLGVAPALAAATGLSATAATYATAATLGALASTATFFTIPSSLSAHIASQNKADEQDELGANVAPAAV